MNDDELNDLIRETHQEPEFSSSFQRDVWARIAVAEQSSFAGRWRQWSEFFFRWVAQPAPALATVASMLIVGVGLGQLTAPDDSVATSRQAYLVSINPVAAAHLAIQE